MRPVAGERHGGSIGTRARAHSSFLASMLPRGDQCPLPHLHHKLLGCHRQTKDYGLKLLNHEPMQSISLFKLFIEALLSRLHGWKWGLVSAPFPSTKLPRGIENFNCQKQRLENVERTRDKLPKGCPYVFLLTI